LFSQLFVLRRMVRLAAMPDAVDPSASAGLPELASGLVLADRYRLEEVAGHGGMSVVWRAFDTVLEHETALKFLPTVLATDRGALSDLRREARRVRDLAHPQICRVYDYGEDDERQLAWISMEYLPGGSLARKLKEQSRGFFEPGDVVGWLRELCEALHYAHEVAHVVHRDLKPANLLLDGRGHLRITDFGIARSISESYTRLTSGFSPAATTRTGTLYYMSPQQARGERARPSDDLYSLGATLFELLTGEPPFTTGDVTWQREHAPPTHLGERRLKLTGVDSPVPEDWEILVQRLLAKHPSHRPQNAKELIAELDKLKAPAPPRTPAPPAAVPASAPETAAKPPPLPVVIRNATTKAPAPIKGAPTVKRMDPWMWALAGLLVIVLVLIAILILIGLK
jgi:serine/threonine protein kinase